MINTNAHLVKCITTFKSDQNVQDWCLSVIRQVAKGFGENVGERSALMF